MKYLKLLLIALLLTSAKCDKDDDGPINPVDLLPPATQTGEQTFGCLLDGKAFLPGNNGNPLDCVYQFVNVRYYFALQSNRTDKDENFIGLGIATENLQIQQNENYILTEKTNGNAY